MKRIHTLRQLHPNNFFTITKVNRSDATIHGTAVCGEASYTFRQEGRHFFDLATMQWVESSEGSSRLPQRGELLYGTATAGEINSWMVCNLPFTRLIEALLNDEDLDPGVLIRDLRLNNNLDYVLVAILLLCEDYDYALGEYFVELARVSAPPLAVSGQTSRLAHVLCVTCDMSERWQAFQRHAQDFQLVHATPDFPCEACAHH